MVIFHSKLLVYQRVYLSNLRKTSINFNPKHHPSAHLVRFQAGLYRLQRYAIGLQVAVDGDGPSRLVMSGPGAMCHRSLGGFIARNCIV
jgi:hypothetical protein